MSGYSVVIDQEQTGFKMERVYIVKTGGDPELDRVATMGCPDGRDEQIATANLFAAAPDLVEALIKARDQFRRYADIHGAKATQDGFRKQQTNIACVIMCQDALAKAGVE